jgi:RNA polymerase sigma factor (sigma-70 family)
MAGLDIDAKRSREDLLTAAFLKCRAGMAKVVGKIVQRHEVDDVLQETFLRSFEASNRTTITYPRAFLLRTATNVAINRTMRAERRLVRSIEDFGHADVYLSSKSLDVDYEAKEQYRLLCKAVESLPARCREVFILRKVYGFSQKEISGLLGISESTVEKHIAKGLLLCKSSIARWTSTKLADMGESAEVGRTEDCAHAERHPIVASARSPQGSVSVGLKTGQRPFPH